MKFNTPPAGNVVLEAISLVVSEGFLQALWLQQVGSCLVLSPP